MNVRNWRYVAALAGIALATSALAQQQGSDSKEDRHPTANAQVGGELGLNAYETQSLAISRAANSVSQEANAIAARQALVGFLQLILTVGAAGAAGAAAYYAMKAAHAADRALTHAQLATKAELRAYVGMAKFDMKPEFSKRTRRPERYMIRIEWQNTGGTPARRLTSSTNAEGFLGGLRSDFDYPSATPLTEAKNLAPSQFHWATIHVTPQQLMSVAAGACLLLVWGWVEYNDVFEGTPRHRTETCYRVVVTGNPVTGAGVEMRLEPWSHFNGADEDSYHSPQTV
jgi:hypothetical protein